MTEVGVTPAALDLHPSHAQAIVRLGCNILWRDRRPETWPSCARIELCIRAEQVVATADALVDPFILAVVVFPRERPFCPLLPTHVELSWSELLAPLLVRLENLVTHWGVLLAW